MVTHISFHAAFGGDSLFSAYIAYHKWETRCHWKFPATFRGMSHLPQFTENRNFTPERLHKMSNVTQLVSIQEDPRSTNLAARVYAFIHKAILPPSLLRIESP